MPPKFHSVHGYIAFDRLVKRVETWAVNSIPAVGNYRSSSVTSRLLQRIVEIGLNPFIQECANRSEKGVDVLTHLDGIMKCGGLVINTSTGITKPASRLYTRSLAEFTRHWLYVLAVFVLSVFRFKKADGGSATLLFGVGSATVNEESGDTGFVEYCMKGPIEPLARARCIIVESARKLVSTWPEHVKYARSPLIELVKRNPPAFSHFSWFISLHLGMLVSYLFAATRCPIICVLGRDFAYHALVASLNQRGLLDAVIITNSNYAVQPLWMKDLPGRRFMAHMVWYSQNTIPFVYAQDPVKADLPNYRHLRVDVSWVWTEGFADHLGKLGIPGEIRVVGPILWYLRKPFETVRNYDKIRIAVFDVTPVKLEVAVKIGLVYNYYRAENMMKFIEDVHTAGTAIQEQTGKRVKILLKHKRSHNPIHDPQYIALIEKLTGLEQSLDLVPPETDMFSFISSCDLAIVIPYSSPAYVANSVGVPAVYYDPTCELMPTFENAPWISFAAGRENLIKAVSDILGRVRAILLAR